LYDKNNENSKILVELQATRQNIDNIQETEQGFGEHQNGKRFLAGNFKRNRCQLLGF
jgi:hypothetical protein